MMLRRGYDGNLTALTHTQGVINLGARVTVDGDRGRATFKDSTSKT